MLRLQDREETTPINRPPHRLRFTFKPKSHKSIEDVRLSQPMVSHERLSTNERNHNQIILYLPIFEPYPKSCHARGTSRGRTKSAIRLHTITR